LMREPARCRPGARHPSCAADPRYVRAMLRTAARRRRATAALALVVVLAVPPATAAAGGGATTLGPASTISLSRASAALPDAATSPTAAASVASGLATATTTRRLYVDKDTQAEAARKAAAKAGRKSVAKKLKVISS